ncbi:MAG: hypothetical protein IPG42_13740 [Betaproteobacteria bacterium]|nr:hypothetical protein [Betaproteobacteria bacterium]
MAPEEIVSKIHTLSDEFELSPPQLAAVMQTTEDQLKTMRENGDGPPFGKLGGGVKSPVRYQLGTYREWRKRHTYNNTSEINVSRFSGMADFLSTGAMDDMYIVAKDSAGFQWEFWEGIRKQADIDHVMWLPMDVILEGFRKGAGARWSEKNAEELDDCVPRSRSRQ